MLNPAPAHPKPPQSKQSRLTSGPGGWARPWGRTWGGSLILGLSAAFLLTQAGASKPPAQGDLPITVEADRLQYEENNQRGIFTGNVVLTRGTLVIRGDRMEIRQDTQGFQRGTVNGSPATFRQQRDTAGQWIEGQARELDYDGRTEVLRLLQQARIRRTDAGRVVDEIEGGTITYDTRSERFTVDAAPSQAPSGRVRITIQPRSTESAPPRGSEPAQPRRGDAPR